jgi:3-dehydroquinate synthase
MISIPTNSLSIIDEKVYNLHQDFIDEFVGDKILIAGDEQSKNLTTVGKLYNEVARYNINRNDYIVAIGGGVVGDMVGFVAATFKRGVKLIHIPTTLLAMVDSSVGGKTGFNLAAGKNLVGAFYQPVEIIRDAQFLKTLDQRQIMTGLSEAIKYYFIDSNNMDELVKGYRNEDQDKIFSISIDLRKIVELSVEIKEHFIEGDVQDFGKRQFLNFGHTFGHALEQVTNYEKYTHGEAIIKGMCLALDKGVELGVTPIAVRDSGINLLQNLGFDTEIDFDVNTLTEAMRQDKKNDSDEITLVLLEGIGKPVIRKVKL